MEYEEEDNLRDKKELEVMENSESSTKQDVILENNELPQLKPKGILENNEPKASPKANRWGAAIKSVKKEVLESDLDPLRLKNFQPGISNSLHVTNSRLTCNIFLIRLYKYFRLDEGNLYRIYQIIYSKRVIIRYIMLIKNFFFNN